MNLSRAFAQAEARSLREPDPPLDECPSAGNPHCRSCTLRRECPDPDTRADYEYERSHD